MKGPIYLIAASVWLGVVAVGATHERRYAHEAFRDLLRRDDVTDTTCNSTCGCITIYSTHYGEATLAQPPPISTSTISVSTTSSSSTTSTASTTSTSTSTAFIAPALPECPTSSSSAAIIIASSSTFPSTSSSSSTPSGPIPSTSQWCITYSPYTPTGQCASTAQVSSDIAAIAAKGFSSVRLYSTDCDGLSTVGAACTTHNLHLILGIYISDTGISGAEDQLTDITSYFAGDYALVEMVVVGNEALFNDYCTAPELAAFIVSVKTTLAAAGYAGPVTTAEPMATLQANAAALCPVVDVLAANIHAFFSPDIEAAQAGAFVAQALLELEGYCPGGKKAYCTETGWPHQGEPNGLAVPGLGEQQVAVEGLVRAVGNRAALVSFVDDGWKAEGAFGVEQSWGCGHLFG